MKRNIFSFLLGAIIFGSMGVMASNYLYHANEVGYNPSDNSWNVSNVNTAIEDLYDKASNSGAIYLGEFSSNTTIDVSNLGATNADQFLVVPKAYSATNDTSTMHPTQAWVYSNYVPASVSLSGNTLSITCPQSWGIGYSVPSGIATYSYNKKNITYRVYYVGDIRSAS